MTYFLFTKTLTVFFIICYMQQGFTHGQVRVNSDYLKASGYEPNLTVSIDLKATNITSLDDNAFGEYLKLETIRLDENELESIGTGTFASEIRNWSVIEISLNQNNISQIAPGAFGKCASLAELYLTSNKLTRLNGTVFFGLGSLKYLDLELNQIDYIAPNTFNATQNLNYLSLQSNRLTEMRGDEFGSFKNLLYFTDLSDNLIERIAPGAFRHCSNLEHLYLSSNRLKQFEGDEFRFLRSLIQLDLQNNFLETFESRVFRDLIRLEKLMISGNPIKKYFEPDFEQHLPGILLDITIPQQNITRKPQIKFSTKKMSSPLFTTTIITSKPAKTSVGNNCCWTANKIRKELFEKLQISQREEFEQLQKLQRANFEELMQFQATLGCDQK